MGCATSSVDVVTDTSDSRLTDMLTPRQVELFQLTWNVISEDAEEVGVVMFARLVNEVYAGSVTEASSTDTSLCYCRASHDRIRPIDLPDVLPCLSPSSQTDKDLKALFVGLAGDHTHYEDTELGVDDLQLKVHSRVVMDVLGAAVECLEDPSVLNPVLFALGQMHAPYGVEPHYLPRLWPAIKYALRQTLQERFTPDVEETWKIVYHFIVGKMMAGIAKTGSPLGTLAV